MKPIDVDSLMEKLLKRGECVAVAESVTGGMVSVILTDRPGSSQTFCGAVVAYQNLIKEVLLEIDPKVLGVDAVNPETAFELAMGAKRLFRCSWGLGITGFAGPDGGSGVAPVGTVFAAVTGPVGRTARFHFEGDRFKVRQEAVWFLLELFASCLDSATALGL